MDSTEKMSYAEVEQWLERAFAAETEIRLLHAAKQRALEQCQPGAQRLDAIGRRSSGSGNSRIQKYIETVERLDRAIERLNETTDEIYRTIMRVPDVTLRVLLFDRYVRKLTWDDIALELDVEPRTVYRLRKKAIESVGAILARKAS